MSPAVIKRTHTQEDLRKKRALLLERIGLSDTSDLEKIAHTRMLSEEEEAIAYELESIAFLLGERQPRIG